MSSKLSGELYFFVTIHSRIKNGSRVLQAKLVRSRLTVFIWLESVTSPT